VKTEKYQTIDYGLPKTLKPAGNIRRWDCIDTYYATVVTLMWTTTATTIMGRYLSNKKLSCRRQIARRICTRLV